jgi:uncharacterized pyridoxamine 5'-phosphate oxidase family protein
LNKTDNKMVQEAFAEFHEQQHVFLATVEGSQPKVRPVTFFRLLDKFFIATDTNDAKVRQMEQNPKVEFCLMLENPRGQGGKGTVRVGCLAKIVQDEQTKAYAYDKIPFTKEYWKSPKDPSYTLIELQPKTIEYMKPGTAQITKLTL